MHARTPPSQSVGGCPHEGEQSFSLYKHHGGSRHPEWRRQKICVGGGGGRRNPTRTHARAACFLNGTQGLAAQIGNQSNHSAGNGQAQPPAEGQLPGQQKYISRYHMEQWKYGLVPLSLRFAPLEIAVRRGGSRLGGVWSCGVHEHSRQVLGVIEAVTDVEVESRQALHNLEEVAPWIIVQVRESIMSVWRIARRGMRGAFRAGHAAAPDITFSDLDHGCQLLDVLVKMTGCIALRTLGT